MFDSSRMCMSALCVLCLGVGVQSSFAQNAKLEVVATAGSYYENTQFNVNWTVGEPVIKTIGSQDYFMTQGFNQNRWELVAVFSPAPLDLDVTIYPNPMVRELTLRFNDFDQLDEEYNFLVYDMLYRPVYEEPIYSAENYYDLSFLENGTYIMHVVNKRGEFVKTFKVIKNE